MSADPKTVRRGAIAHGIPVGKTGKLPHSVFLRYFEATGEAPDVVEEPEPDDTDGPGTLTPDAEPTVTSVAWVIHGHFRFTLGDTEYEVPMDVPGVFTPVSAS